jgi:hypothetical protein
VAVKSVHFVTFDGGLTQWIDFGRNQVCYFDISSKGTAGMAKDWRLWATITVVISMWLVIGFIPYWIFGAKHMNEAADAGDMFGAANALFSALAFVAVFWALRLQHEEIQGAVTAQGEQSKIQTEQLKIQTDQLNVQSRLIEEQQRQTEIAQKTARLQACSFLADLHYRMTEGTKGEVLERLKTLGEYYANRSRELMEEMGEQFPGHPGDRGQGAIEVVTAVSQGVADLKGIANALDDTFARENAASSESNDAAVLALTQFRRDFHKWSQTYKDHFKPSAIQHISECASVVGETSIHLVRKRASDFQWDKWWGEAIPIYTAINNAVNKFMQQHN